MMNSIRRSMSKATELTKAGKLKEATALIQSLLTTSDPVSRTPDVPEKDEAIDAAFTRLGDATPAPAKRAARQARSGLGETLRKIAAGGMPAGKGGTVHSPNVPEGAAFLSATHSTPQGQREYRLYIPANRNAEPMPLVVLLHGCTQTPEDFAIGTGMNELAEEMGFLVAYPAQPSGANMQKCWNWFRPEDQSRDAGEPRLIAGLTADILRDHPADPARVYVAGLSAGGAAAAIVASAYPDVFSAVGVHSGLAVGAARDIPSAFSAMRSGAGGDSLKGTVPTIVFHGLADSTVHPKNGTAVLTQALKGRRGLKQSTAQAQSAGGRAYRQHRFEAPAGPTLAEHWEIDSAGHAWAGGRSQGSYTDPAGPDASREMVRFFLQHRKI